ncbi:SURF6-domain-containing protein [Delitschia confertaspora ATCC 74209]|uniref:SURF6-domain-containing protein n=1 Tax=Delitschia confertaspora ATCC 74209 TaxID=1513339 RepID=A0A9P4JPX9_9PLEO|nr:SURF6-domain-containing protein [Delitschia confertaspora ATCC 74209]
MADDLEAHLRSHGRAFEGLMALIPAKEYYGKDASITSEQWRKTKKQTREERQNAKRAKLDPASHKTAKDVLDENARKRKLELEGGDDSSEIDFDVEKEKPLEGLKMNTPKPKKQKTDKNATAEDAADEANDNAKATPAQVKAEKRRQKREEKKEKAALKKQKIEEKKAQKEEAVAAFTAEHDVEDESEGDDTQMADIPEEEDRMEALDVSGLVEEHPSTATPSTAESTGSAASEASAASSTSSIVPPITVEGTANPEKPAKKKFELSPERHEAFKARLQAKLNQLRAARRADGPDGRPARNRAELIEARRKKEQERKAAKKENRQLAKEDEARLKAEAELARLRGSGSPYSISGMFPPSRSTPEHETNLAFGRVAWRDGTQMDTKLSGVLDSRKHKGPSDPKTALAAAEKKRARISGLDEAKRTDIEQKDLWLAAKKRAQGEKVHDDPTLLRKSVKRKEKAKQKSKQEWKDRITGIEKGKEMKQKKREENLLKRRDEKKGGKAKKGKKPAKKVKRAGFEGTFRGR